MQDVEFISLIQLIQHPDKFHGHKVRIIGVACLQFECKAIFVSSEDLKKAVTKNAVWVDVDLTDANKRLSGKHVLLEGKFDKTNLGHLRMYSGSITNVSRLEEWKGDPKE